MPYFDTSEERLPRDALALLQRRKLRAMWEPLVSKNAFYQRKLAAIAFDPDSDPLDRLPFTTREEIQQDQIDHAPYGSNLTYPHHCYRRVHQTSGSRGTPMRWLDTEESWSWWKRCWAIIYRAAGLTPDDRIMFPFSFGPFIGFWGAFESAAALGNFCLPCGGMTTIARLHYMIDHQATVICCTPTYALRMAEVAAEEGIDLAASPVRILVVAGEPGGNVPATRHSIQRAWDARVIDHAGMTEIGPWGFECAEVGGGVHVMECEFIAEVVDSVTGEAVPNGKTGELVLTNLGRVGSPLIRYRTGDQVRLTQGRCACGRWFARADAGILGRIDDMLVIRGNNVFPSAVENIIRGFAEIAEFRIQVDEQGPMLDLYVLVEAAPQAEPSELPSRVAAAIRDRLHFTARVGLVEPGTLPRFEMKAQRVQRLRGSGAAGHG